MRDLITVIMPTSPIPSHPDTSITENTIASIREQEALKDCEIIVVADGVRKEQQKARKKDYDEYLRRLLWKANHEMDNVLVQILPEHGHQANSTRLALTFVRTPLILFMEHDTPIFETFDWPALTRAAQDDRVNLIRFHHEAWILEPHAHLMPDYMPPTIVHRNIAATGRPEVRVQDICGAPLTRTVQWSQRPHLAKTEFYRHIINTYFGKASRTMIEDVMHGVVQEAWNVSGEKGWEQFKLWMYMPSDTDIKRSGHADGRGADPKFDMLYEYDGEVPEYAPAPMSGRVD